MSEKYTAEPWYDAKSSTVKFVELPLCDYIRATVCVNACAGISTADLEAGAVEKLIEAARTARNLIRVDLLEHAVANYPHKPEIGLGELLDAALKPFKGMKGGV